MHWLTPAGLREPVLGDLEEEFHDQCSRSTPRAARAWYWDQVRRSSPHTIALLMRASRWLAVILAAGLGYAASGLLLTVFFALFRQAYEINLFQGVILLALGVRMGLELIALTSAGFLAGLVLATAERRGALMLAGTALLVALPVLVPDLLALQGVEVAIARNYVFTKIALGLPFLAVGAWLGSRVRLR